ncbi:type II toxin-antitoxin system HigB family toxin [Dysgonomonas macrotermitis]|uniref:mRNA interferase HigB n=1 Tax=Dysgonomonas macrotermitis TaxID=1346286 RepID=A0A1M5JW62_9BACT|nr:type II toxin-antitoxin system HigB family toxin [Dysgonomonas macrotermitis]SHG44784.1 mRNA interferase HigB [Dysgonomonas macrotermitis]
MRIFVQKTIVDFYNEHADAKTALQDWYIRTKEAEWNNFAEMKNTFNSVDLVGNKRYVFNIKGNNYRLVAIVLFVPKYVYIRFIGTHAEYDKIEDCSQV